MSASQRTNELSQNEAHDWFFYDPHTGKLHWKMKPGRHSNVTWGDEAGGLNDNGYVKIQLQGKPYGAHNIIWNMHYGKIPDDKSVDHIDRDPRNNRIENLRLASSREQGVNRNVRGFCWVKRHNKWEARHRLSPDKRKYLGQFSTALQARLAYERATFELDPEFADTWLTDALSRLCTGSPTSWTPSLN